jgi:DNA-binding transcriptional LysR family regulator
MEIRLLKYVLAVYKNKSFTKAAEELHIAQPSLSKQIAKLEHEFGIKLFYRGHGKVEPTLDGLRFVDQAEKILRMQNDLERELYERKQGVGGELIIGSTPVTGGRILPPLLQAFSERYPNVAIRLVEESTEELTNLTVKGLIDLSILALPVENPLLATKKMLTEPLYVALPREPQKWMPVELQNFLSSSKTNKVDFLTMEELANYPFILLKQGFGFRRTVLELCAKGGFQPHVAYETSSIELAQSLVGYGLGITIVPDMVVHRDTQKCPLYFKLDSKPTRTLVFAYNRERYLSATSRALIKIYEEYN